MIKSNSDYLKLFRSRPRRASRWLGMVLLRSWVRLRFCVRVSGRVADVSRERGGHPLIIVANHSSHLDTLAIVASLPLGLALRLAIGAAADHFFGNVRGGRMLAWLLNLFPIARRGSRANKGLTDELVRAGVPVLLFPEGTRTRTGKMGKFHGGVFRIAVQNGAIIQPVALSGMGKAWPVGSAPVSGRSRVGVKFLPPVDASQYSDADELKDAVFEAISSNVASQKFPHPGGEGRKN